MTITEDELFKIIIATCGSLKHSSARYLAATLAAELEKRECGMMDKLVADVAKLKKMKRADALTEARWQR